MSELRRVSSGILVTLMIIAFSATYWSVIGDKALLQRNDNPRLVEAETVVQRGTIYDEQGVLLATTTVNYNGRDLRRLYPHPEVAPVTGYYSLRYGVSGIEATYDDLLMGREGPGPIDEAIRTALHQPAVGGDVLLTLNLQIQKVAAAALEGYNGAIAVVTIPDGAVRALVSAPIFDPNMLDEDWDVLINNANAPLLNRVTQGLYQPGGFLQSVLMAMAISERAPLDEQFISATDPVQVNGLTLTCGGRPPEDTTLSLVDAYLYACPGAFAEITALLSPSGVDEALWRFGLLTPPRLLGLNTESADSPLQLAIQESVDAIRAGLVGQGALTISPLQALEFTAAVGNNGNIPLFHVVDSVRLPGTDPWMPIPNVGLSRAVLTQQASSDLRSMMRRAATDGVAMAAQAESEYPIMGHAATAFSGPEAMPLQWFIGLVDLGDNRAAAVVVVIEGADSPADAAEIGGRVLDTAAHLYAPSSASEQNEQPRISSGG